MTTPTIDATLMIQSSDLCDSILQRIDYNGQFTTVTANDPKDILTTALALCCLEPFTFGDSLANVTHICILRKGQRVATGQIRIKGTDIVKLPDIPLNQLVDTLPKNFHSNGRKAFGIDYQKVGEKTGIELFKALLKLCPKQESDILNLEKKLRGKPLNIESSRAEDIAAEKDALGICLDIFGINRSEILGSWTNTDGSIGNSFLSGLTQYVAYEDDIISQDMHNLPGWKIVSESIAGIVEFQNEDNEKLTVINANRKPLEKALGVDLIYFHRKYEAFTFIQYKMMDQKVEKTGAIYFNPNQKSHTEELKRMQQLLNMLSLEKNSTKLNDYRLSNCPIFFKVCKKLTLKPNETSIASGAYIPVDQWAILLSDTSTLGPKGGCQIGYHTLKKRYIGTQVFVELMQKGFLGTQSISSKKIALFIEDAIKNGHSVVYAIDERNSIDDEGDE